MGMRMCAIVATPDWLTRTHKERRGVPGPGYQDGQSKGKITLVLMGLLSMSCFF